MNESFDTPPSIAVSSDRLSSIVESSDDAIITTKPDGTITSWNGAATRIFGYGPAQTIGRDIAMLFPPERLPEEESFMTRIARGDRVEHVETQRVREDGTTIDVSVTLSPIPDQHGRIVEISEIARDITAQKRIEAEAREQEDLFQVMADTAPVMIWMAGSDTLCTFFNKRWLDFTGRTMEQELGNGWADGVHPADLPRCLDTYLSSFHARQPFRIEYRLRSASGSHRWILDTGVPRYTRREEFAGYIGSAVDIDDVKNTAEALASEIDTTRAFFEGVAEGIVIVNERGDIVRVNAKAEEMFGYGHQELVGRPLEMLLPERFRTDHGGHRARYFEAPRSRPMELGLDLFGRRSDGREFPLEISLSWIRTTTGPLAMALVTDISERRRLEQAVRHQERLTALATLSAGIAHELNNPIGIILGRIELMLQDATSRPLPDEVTDDLHVLHRNTHRVSRIARGLLSFARHSPGAPRLVNVNAVIEETLLLASRQLGKDGVHLIVALDETLGPIWGDGNALEQVLMNLLLNARDAMPHGGQLRIETGPDPDRAGWLRLTVADTGGGIRSDDLEDIWKPFYTTKTSGTGLGLSVSHRIIREHGGLMDVRSEVGRGTTFVIRLPLQSSPSPPL